MSRSIAPLSKLRTAFAVTGTVIAGACSGNLADPDPFPPGLLAIQLQPGGPVQLESISYTVTGPGGFSRSGPVAVSLTDARSSFSFKVEGLPPGEGYMLGVDADATLVQRGDATHCSGLTQFAIETGKSTAVSIRLQCDGVATTGSTNDDQTVNQCPVVKGLRAVPAGGPVGSVVQLYADVDDTNDGPGPTSYAWTCGGGMLAGSKLETMFHCTRSGVSTVNLTLSDGDAACSESQAFVYVVCTDAKCLAAHNCDVLPDPVAGSGGSATRTAAAGVGASGAGAGGSSAGVGGVGAVISANAGSTASSNTNPSTTQPSAGVSGAGGHAAAADGGSWEPPTWPKSGGAGGVGGDEMHVGEDVPRHHRRAAAGSGGMQAQGGATGGSAAGTSAAGSTASGAGASSAGAAGSGAAGVNVAGSEATTAGAAANAAGMSSRGPANTSGAGGVGI